MGNYLVVGLGNIGSEYANTRHNMGFMVLDAWAQASNTVFSVDRYGSVLNLRLKGNVITLLKPSTYMNLSGKAVRYWLDRLKVPVSNLLVISDDLNLPYGIMRMRKSGSSGGHNGLENISMLLGTDEYARLRLGIGHDFGRGGQVDFVLGELSGEEKALLPDLLGYSIEAVKAFVQMGPDKAMSLFNSKKLVPRKSDTEQGRQAQ
ncbi:MAG: aminoacyl-tRNA hydrolase [Bacteroidetes bacterium]|uniref:Peptidyl-tRNA hydrolase n=1 Tax=Candidatus Merdivivens pullicola TaxID=2840872 RepID=A0A9D9NGC4_9BACT|nr:aminoacyl-tRNA hydrolase [Candidatus Merdivivens pullicola]